MQPILRSVYETKKCVWEMRAEKNYNRDAQCVERLSINDEELLYLIVYEALLYKNI